MIGHGCSTTPRLPMPTPNLSPRGGWLRLGARLSVRRGCLSLLLAVAVVIVAAGVDQLAAQAGAGAPATGETVGPLIVVAGPDSGPNAVVTREVRAGVEEALADCRKFWPQCPTTDFVPHACSSSPEDLESVDRAVAAIIAREPVLVVGHACERAARTAAEAYAEAGVAFVAVGVRDPAFLEGFETVPIARIGSNRADEPHALIAMAALPVAIVHDRTLRNSMRARLVSEGLAQPGAGLGEPSAPVVTIGIEASNVNYEAAAEGVVQSGAASVVLLTDSAEAAIVIRQLRASGFGGDIVGPGEWVSDGLAAALGGVGEDRGGRLLALVPEHTAYAIGELGRLMGGGPQRTRGAVRDLLEHVGLVPGARRMEADASHARASRADVASKLVGYDARHCSYTAVGIGLRSLERLSCAPGRPDQF